MISETAFVSAGADGMLVQWNIKDPSQGVLLVNAEEPIYSLIKFEEYLILGLKSGKIYCHHLQNSQESKLIDLGKNSIYSACTFNKKLLIGAANGILYELDNQLRLKKKVQAGSEPIRSMMGDGNGLYVGATGGMLFKLSVKMDIIEQTKADEATIFSICKVNNTIITGSRNALIKQWDKNLKPIGNPIQAHLHQVKYLAHNNKLNLIGSCSMDKSIRFWDDKSFDLVKVINHEKHEAHTSSINCGLWFNENTFISCSDDRKIFAFKIKINPT